MQRLLALLLLVCVSGVASVASATITITSGYTLGMIHNGSVQHLSESTNAGGGIVSLSSLPGYSSITTTSFLSAGLSSAFDQVRGGDFGSYATGHSSVGFTSDVDVRYTARGTYSSSLAGYTQLYSYLYDYATNSYTYFSQQQSTGVAAAFTLGGTTGNEYNDFSGSLTGTIVAGRQYQWVAAGATLAIRNADLGAVASGSVTLDFAPVSEVSSFAIGAFIAFASGVVALRRRH